MREKELSRKLWQFFNNMVLTIVYGIQYNRKRGESMDYNAILEGLQSELKRGTQVLAVLSQLKKNQYGYSLLQNLVDQKVAIEAGTLYPLLRRLESQGLLESEWDTTESRPRKYYILSRDGKLLFEDLKREWNRMVQEMDHMLKGENNHE
jgi:PadR family transcriptional regulator, regulatory protein PadR